MGSTNANKTVKEASPATYSSSSPEPYAYLWSTENSTLIKTLVGGSLLSVFIATWLLSASSPAFFMILLYNNQWSSVVVFSVLSISAYLPWEKGYVSQFMSAYARCNVFYYKKLTLIFQSKESIPKKDDSQPKLYAVHPHGAFCLGWSVLFCSGIMNDARVRFCFSPVLYASPFFRLWCRLVGCPGSAAKAAMVQYMKGKNKPPKSAPDHLALPPGGFEEATISYLEKDRVYIKKRVGFVKLALQHGYNVVPVYTFGENESYFNAQGLWKFRLWLNGMGIPAIAIFGAWFLPLLPKRQSRGLRVVVGDPIELPTIPNPTREEVKLWHDKYIAALTRLFDEHKEEYYGPEMSKTVKLELW